MKEKLNESFQDFWDTTIAAAPSVLVGLILFSILMLIGWGVSRLMRRRLLKYSEDVLLINFTTRAIWLIFFVFAFFVFLNRVGLGDAASGLLAGAGVSALILGFAFKDIGENFVAGFFLAFSRPFGIGDIIEVQDNTGKVAGMNFRNTHIRTFTGRDIFLPNALLLKNPLVNYTRDGLLRHDFVIGLDYGDNIAKAIRAVMEELTSNGKIVQESDLTPFVVIQDFAVSTINLKIHFWINTKDFLGSMTVLKSEIMGQVYDRLKKDGFNMPADIVELKIYQEGSPIPVMIYEKDIPKS
ncbi:mechanosensitive ion channel family protein [Fulvivirga sedimenti]|uniref:Mechanosensitive ion channel family protein n=1 Tax=Fulvivirga sedimenti TaxID=2879465 RepID=A0A9X1HP70_9BACT|nr:mechanosensitive ion channel family protein [Fulvivirga sedimenti]MCA6073642.1 mechanosensitive ion channel family protein [Fulvivirga sedimenti]